MVWVLLKISRYACLLLLVCACAAAQTASTPAPDLKTIVSRMLLAQHRNRVYERAFTVKRDYQLLDKEQTQEAQVIAHITYMPPDQKQYQIVSSHGGLGETILKRVLKKEVQPPKDPGRQELSETNYEFQYLGSELVDGRHCYVLGLNPRRKDKDLLRGRVWVDQQTYNIRRLEGDPAKNPSWWIRDLHVQMSFADVDGMWLHTSTYAVADVRFKGRYEMVSRDLEYQLGTGEIVRRVKAHPRPAIVAGFAFNP